MFQFTQLFTFKTKSNIKINIIQFFEHGNKNLFSKFKLNNIFVYKRPQKFLMFRHPFNVV